MAATGLLAFIGAFSFVAAALIARLPVATCPECPHCLEAARQDAEEQRRLRREVEARWHLLPRCPRCGAAHDPEDDH